MSRRANEFDIAVVGAGVVGAAAALALAGEGLRVLIVEAHEPPAWSGASPDLRVYAIAADAQALLESLGVWNAIAETRAHPYRRMRIHDAAGGGELCFDADALGRDNLGHIIEHALLVDRLWSAVAAHPAIERRCPAKLRDIGQDQAGVALVLADETRLQARLLIGADGATSRVRQLAGLSSSERDYGQHGLVAYVRTALPHEDTCWQRFLPSGPLAFLPCADGRCSIVWTLPDSEAQRLLELDADLFRAELTRAFDARLGEVLEVSARRAFPLRRRLAGDMLAGRVALLGDAAHVVHPLAGQGVNLGLRDVAGLLQCVREARAAGRDFTSAHRLQRWARTRRSENAIATYSFEAINGLFSNDSLLPTLLRGHLLGIAGTVPPLAQMLWKRASGL